MGVLGRTYGVGGEAIVCRALYNLALPCSFTARSREKRPFVARCLRQPRPHVHSTDASSYFIANVCRCVIVRYAPPPPPPLPFPNSRLPPGQADGGALLENVRQRGEQLRAGLEQLRQKYPQTISGERSLPTPTLPALPEEGHSFCLPFSGPAFLICVQSY